ncbi:oligosaccharide flippase family protein [Erythrobacter sp. NE805]|uniref:oligosaccharide flippase family protein n=1 Tax=Erythrobacter sp. NE805 TaxID=3389875 RepID=UPI00396B1B41
MALAKNSIYNLATPIIAVVVTIATVPLFIKLIGTERYGALLLAFVLLGYFGQADFGLGRALTQRLSSSTGASADERARVVWSAIAGASVISLVGGVLVYVAADLFFRWSFNASPGLRAEILSATWLFALCVPVIMLTGVTSGALGGLERFGMIAVGTTIGNVLSQTLPLLVALLWSSQFTWVLSASMFGRLLGLAPIAFNMARVFLLGQKFNPAMAELKRLFSFGKWVMVSAVVGPFLTSADRMVIGAVLGAAAVVAYTVPVQITMRTVMFPYAIIQALFPRLAAHDEQESLRLGKSATVMVGQLFGFIAIGIICLAEPLLHLWLGAKLDPRSVPLAQISIIGFWISGLVNVPIALIHARGNPRFTAVLHVIQLPIYAALLYGFGVAFGLNGVAVAMVLRFIIDGLPIFHKAGFLTRDVMSRLAGPALLIGLALAATPWMRDWISALFGASLFCLALLALTLRQMPEEAREWVKVRLQR